MEVFGATSDPPKHRGDVEEIYQTKRYLSKPEPGWLVARSRSNNQPCRPGLDRSQDENPAEIQVQTAIISSLSCVKSESAYVPLWAGDSSQKFPHMFVSLCVGCGDGGTPNTRLSVI